MSNPLLQKNCLAGAAIPPWRIVKFSAQDTVVLAAAATDPLIGVSNEVGPNLGERCDIVVFGIAWVTAGAAFAQGALLTSDANGNAIAAAPAAGINYRIIGSAYDAAAAPGDVVRVLLGHGSVQG